VRGRGLGMRLMYIWLHSKWLILKVLGLAIFCLVEGETRGRWYIRKGFICKKLN